LAKQPLAFRTGFIVLYLIHTFRCLFRQQQLP